MSENRGYYIFLQKSWAFFVLFIWRTTIVFIEGTLQALIFAYLSRRDTIGAAWRQFWQSELDLRRLSKLRVQMVCSSMILLALLKTNRFCYTTWVMTGLIDVLARLICCAIGTRPCSVLIATFGNTMAAILGVLSTPKTVQNQTDDGMTNVRLHRMATIPSKSVLGEFCTR